MQSVQPVKTGPGTFSAATRTALVSLLAQYPEKQCTALLQRHALLEEGEPPAAFFARALEVRDQLLTPLLDEVIGNDRELRAGSRYSQQRLDERWQEIVRSLRLDGYAVQNGLMLTLVPPAPGRTNREDLLTSLLRGTAFPEGEEVIHLLADARLDLQSANVNYAAALSSCRAALELIVKSLAAHHPQGHGKSGLSFEEALRHLEKKEFIPASSAQAIAHVHAAFLSPSVVIGARVGEQERVLLGRDMALSLCYYLVLLHKTY